MNAFCNLLLITAGGLSMLIVPMSFGSRGSIGPDRIAGPVVFSFLLLARWFCMSFALARAATQGAFSSEPNGGGLGAAFGMVVVYSVLELFSLFCTDASPRPIIIFPVLMPLTVGAYMFWWFLRAAAVPAPPRLRWIALGSTVGVMAVGLVVVAIVTGIQEYGKKDPVVVAE